MPWPQAVPASKQRFPHPKPSTALLQIHGVEVRELNRAGTLDLYMDGADEFDAHRRLIKGGGGALTREKIVAAASRKFVCIVDESKKVGVLGQVSTAHRGHPDGPQLRGAATGRDGRPAGACARVSSTDNGNVILDVHNMDLVDPVGAEKRHQQPGRRGDLRPVRPAPR